MNYEELVTCPYNKFHQIKKSRIQYHILKCKKVMVYYSLLTRYRCLKWKFQRTNKIHGQIFIHRVIYYKVCWQQNR